MKQHILDRKDTRNLCL